MWKTFVTLLMAIFFIPAFINFCFSFQNRNKLSKCEVVSEMQDVVNNVEFEKNIRPSQKNLPLENYIKGVVAAEMPVSFEMEALKAQAVAARTYAIKHYDGKDYKNLYQAYISIEDMKKNWGDDFYKNYKKISDAVDATNNETIKYNEEMIEAVFHSTSCGVTENSENVWEKSLPYLKSVDSHEDENAPNFKVVKKIPVATVVKLINDKFSTGLTEKNFTDKFIIAQRTNAGYVKNINVCGKNVSAMDVRFLLGLRSTNFTFYREGDNIIFTTKGYGHGAGMSQYGANFMARQGYNYKQILQHYYSGTEIS